MLETGFITRGYESTRYSGGSDSLVNWIMSIIITVLQPGKQTRVAKAILILLFRFFSEVGLGIQERSPFIFSLYHQWSRKAK